MPIFMTLLFICLSFPASAAVPDQENLRFEILRNDKPFGFHEINFSQEGGQLKTDITIEMTYKFGPFTLFQYRHKNREVFEAGRLISMNAETNDDGKDLFVRVEKQEDMLSVKTHKDSYTAHLSALPSTYWHTLYLDREKLINTQYGGYNPVTIEEQDTQMREVAGQQREVAVYDFEDLEAGNKATFFYDRKTGQWVGLEMRIRGSRLSYIRQTPLTGNAEYGQDYVAGKFK